MKLNREQFLIAALALSASAGGCDLGGSAAQVSPEERAAAARASGTPNVAPGGRDTLERPELGNIPRSPTSDPRAGSVDQGSSLAPSQVKTGSGSATTSQKGLVGSPTKEAGLPTPTKEASLPTPTKEVAPTKEAGLPAPTKEVGVPPPTKEVAAPTKEK